MRRQEETQSRPLEACWEWRLDLDLWIFWEGNCYLEYPTGCEVKLVKNFGEVRLGEEDRSVPLVGVKNEPEYSMEGLPPLHGFRRSHFVGSRVDSRESVVVDHTGPATSMGNEP